MKFLFRSLETLKVDNVVCVLRVKADDGWLIVSIDSQDVACPITATPTVSYAGSSAAMTQISPTVKEVRLPYSDSVKTLGVSGAAFNYQGTAVSSFSWSAGLADADPAVELDFYGARQSNYVDVGEHSVVAPDNLNLRILEAIYWIREPGGAWVRYTMVPVVGKINRPMRFASTSPEYVAGRELKMQLVYALFATANDARESYTGIAEADTQAVQITPSGTPFVPLWIEVGMLTAGAPVRVAWAEAIDTNANYVPTAYELQRSVNGGSFTLLYSALSYSYTDTLPDGAEEVVYQVRTVSGSKKSGWRSSGTLEVTQSNLFVMTAAGLKAANAVLIGTASGAVQVAPIVSVGRGT